MEGADAGCPHTSNIWAWGTPFMRTTLSGLIQPASMPRATALSPKRFREDERWNRAEVASSSSSTRSPSKKAFLTVTW
jgi:hypothetical protein